MHDYSFSSDSNTKNLSKLEDSILQEYKRLGFGEDTIQYSLNSLNFEDLPQNFPQQFTQQNRKCLRLSSCAFFEMLTYSIFQFLLSNRSPQKDQIIKKIRKQIAQKFFMQDSPSTKGLLLKGLKMMYDYVELSKGQKPIAHCMWKNDSMLAYTQFWKCLLSKISIRNIVTAQNTSELDVGLFQLLADYLGMNFSIYYEYQNSFENQLYISKRKISSLKLSIVVYCHQKSSKKNQCSRILDSSLMTEKYKVAQSLDWSYIVIEDTAEYYRSQLEKQEISEIHQVQQSVVDQKQEIMRLFKCRTKSELNYNSSMNQRVNQHGVFSSPISQVKQLKGLQTTRTKKLTQTTRQRTPSRKLYSRVQKNNSFQTQQKLESIKYNMHLGDKLIADMKQFYEKIRV